MNPITAPNRFARILAVPFILAFSAPMALAGDAAPSALSVSRESSAARASDAPAAAQGDSRENIRLFFERGSKRLYFNGLHWMQMRVIQKIGLVERVRRGALKMNALMTLPAEIYVRELDGMYREHPEARSIEVGQAIQGIAVSLKDWDEMGVPKSSK